MNPRPRRRPRGAAPRLSAAFRWPAAALVAAGLTAATPPGPAPARPGAQDQSVSRLADEYLDGLLAARPDLATRLGDHRRDALLEPMDERALDAEEARLAALEQRLASISRPDLSAAGALERDVLSARLEAERVELETVRPWQRDPAAYLALAGDAIQSVLERGPLSPCERSRALARRLARVPEALRGARVNLRDPPRVLVEEAGPALKRLLRFYRESLPDYATICRDERNQADLAQADSAAVRAASDFMDYLAVDLRPRAGGPAALGEEATARWLRAVAFENAPADSLIERGRRELAALQARLDTVTSLVAPGGGPGAALDSLRARAPLADSLPASFELALRDVRTFIVAHALVDLPEVERIQVRKAPVYHRGGPLVALDAPGPWEPASSQSWIEVTPPDSSWSAERQRAHLAALAPWSARVMLLREVYPGRYLQTLAWRKVTSRLRLACPPPTITEGWARYAQQVAIEQGFGGGDPRIELAWLLETRGDVARAVAALGFHAERMSLEDAAALLQRAAELGADDARREARRLAAGLDAAAPTIGRWQILDLRAELRARLGERFDLRAFHRALLRQGGVPLALARDAVLGETESPAGAPHPH